MSDRVLREVSGGIGRVTLNRPDKRNAMDTPMVDGLHAALDEFDLRADVSVIAVQGAGPDFCAGADLAELLASADAEPAENAASAARLGEVFVRMRTIPKPVVALVHGRALAGGCGLATACDLIVAHEEARLGYPEIQRGFVPAMVMAMLVRAVGEKTAIDLVATGRVLTAAEAQGLGLVARVYPAAGFSEEAEAFLTTLAGASGAALAMIKQQVYALDPGEFAEDIRLGTEVNAAARATTGFREAVSRFLDKRA